MQIRGEVVEKVPFIPVVKDGRDKLRGQLYQQTVRIKTEKTEHCGTIFDVDGAKGVAFALTILTEASDRVEVVPLYSRAETLPDVVVLYAGPALKGSVRRAANGIAVVEVPMKVNDRIALRTTPLPLASAEFDYNKSSYIACGWSPAIGVTAPCSAIRGGIVNGFSTYYATPREGWMGSGYYSNSGYLVGLCDSPPDREGHGNRLGSYVNIQALRKSLKEIKYEFTLDYGKKKDRWIQVVAGCWS